MDVLLLVHRLPYPPNKGDKVRSYHLLHHLSAKHRVHMATFVDDPGDLEHVLTVAQWCTSSCIVPIAPWRRKIAGALALLRGRSLSVGYYDNRSVRQWVESTLNQQPIGAAVVFSSVMAQFVAKELNDKRIPVLVDLVDVDSQKWAQYAQQRSGPLAWLFALEARLLLAYERRVAAQSKQTYLVTTQEATLFKRLAPESEARVSVLENGVDAEYFAPLEGRTSPYAQMGSEGSVRPLVFTGAMDYWPNVDGVCWFAKDILPLLRQQVPGVRLYVVGRKPSQEVLDLAGEHVIVTGGVPDIRPYLQFAEVAVAPLRIARGIQNKVLEAMAMARPVVTSASCAQVVHGATDSNLRSADSAESFAMQILQLLESPKLANQIGL
ncbi:MAG: hypothetical protein RLZZ126_973, partial [Pseudomonadota bacterium]